MQPGIYPNLSDDEYHASAGISNSGLLVIANKTPAHYKAWLDEPREPTQALIDGRRIHRAVLEPDKFASEFAVAPKFDMRTKAGKSGAVEWVEQNPGKVMLSEDHYETFSRIRDAVHAHPACKLLLSNHVAEQSVYANDPVTGVLARCRPDINYNGGSVLADLKSTADASEDAFKSASFNYGYHQQAAFYLDVYEWATGRRPDSFIFIAVEKAAPYAVKVFESSPSFISRGRESYRRALDIYADCLANNHWPGYDETVAQLDLPVWVENMLQAKDNDEIEGISYVEQ